MYLKLKLTESLKIEWKKKEHKVVKKVFIRLFLPKRTKNPWWQLPVYSRWSMTAYNYLLSSTTWWSLIFNWWPIMCFQWKWEFSYTFIKSWNFIVVQLELQKYSTNISKYLYYNSTARKLPIKNVWEKLLFNWNRKGRVK